MRLLERVDGEFQLVTFSLDVPCYAVLSHTWDAEEDEVSFDDLLDDTAKTKPGYAKLEFCANQAWHDGLRFFWIDTCCIHRANVVEVEEAINSMSRWYREASRCYVYLKDVSVSARPNDYYATRDEALRRSRWFTRSWTLIELLVPPSVKFYSKEAAYLGNRQSLDYKIHDITSIPLEALHGVSLDTFSVEERMRWARHRQTTHREDRAYSLMGLFHVEMPLNYGEGEAMAFQRLRKEIVKSKTPPDVHLKRIPGRLYISPPAHYFDAVDGYYVGETGIRVPISDALGQVPVVEPVGGCKTVVRCNVAPPVSMASGHVLRFVPDVIQ